MKRSYLWQGTLLLALVGCSTQSSTPNANQAASHPDTTTTITTEGGATLTFVSLKVPNMV